ncbi:Uncharacterised protein [Klebsiella pneumoniae]|nr:Uncharacterised protein [Klebsiella pneumoniae]SVP64340.1 Uncharacterised protein [Klebsiella pneumoniae]SVQ00370.1 Uncharacterised protein [Klebsiella pneumoniae]SVR46091.1 Uncharacterised protein [Klebsiella pneumoniae]SVT63822.1 Uncharacterised protein [Klebsiella pneumoniae]
MTPPLFICFFNQLFTGIVGCGLTSRGNGADFGILRMDFIKAVLLKFLRRRHWPLKTMLYLPLKLHI